MANDTRKANHIFVRRHIQESRERTINARVETENSGSFLTSCGVNGSTARLRVLYGAAKSAQHCPLGQFTTEMPMRGTSPYLLGAMSEMDHLRPKVRVPAMSVYPPIASGIATTRFSR